MSLLDIFRFSLMILELALIAKSLKVSGWQLMIMILEHWPIFHPFGRLTEMDCDLSNSNDQLVKIQSALTHPWLLIWCIYIYEYVSFSFALVRGFIAFWAFQDFFKCSNGEWALYRGCMIWLVGHMPRIIYENGMDNNPSSSILF